MPERLWDKFLTGQDKAHVAMGEHKQVGFGEKPALLLIDLYRWVFGDKPQPILEATKDWPASCGLAAWDAIPAIQTVLKAARDAGIPVVHATGRDDDGLAGWSTGREVYGNYDRSPEALERRNRRHDIIDEVAPLDGEPVMRKDSPSAFWGTPLIGHLNAHNIDTIITVGETTSGCVRASVLDGCTNRYRMIVVEEGVFDRHEAAHAINLFDMNQKYADVLLLAEVLEYLGEVGAKHAAKN
ncbi:MAG TPA: isochorismatase family protein [Dehalococcoidia bacterium]|nr:isochorismatase family protein [Dehalococcoidia bacterium]